MTDSMEATDVSQADARAEDGEPAPSPRLEINRQDRGWQRLGDVARRLVDDLTVRRGG